MVMLAGLNGGVGRVISVFWWSVRIVDTFKTSHTVVRCRQGCQRSQAAWRQAERWPCIFGFSPDLTQLDAQSTRRSAEGLAGKLRQTGVLTQGVLRKLRMRALLFTCPECQLRYLAYSNGNENPSSPCFLPAHAPGPSAVAPADRAENTAAGNRSPGSPRRFGYGRRWKGRADCVRSRRIGGAARWLAVGRRGRCGIVAGASSCGFRTYFGLRTSDFGFSPLACRLNFLRHVFPHCHGSRAAH
jgi:hypothetical protein